MPSQGIVEVLLSTYNGVRYLPELLESMWKQEYPNITISVRDDGSVDGTDTLVAQLLLNREGARFAAGKNLGVANSFLTLLADVSEEARFAAFCDQDDVWMPTKLSRAVEALAGIEGPALYCSAIQLVTDDLSTVGMYRRNVRGPSFANALVENIATGCTIVLNREAIDLLRSRIPEQPVMHDAWCYLVVSAFGTIIYDECAHTLYRLHESNAIGLAKTPVSDWTRRLIRHMKTGRERVFSRQASEFERVFGPILPEQTASTLYTFLSARCRRVSRFRYALSGEAYRQRRLDNAVFRVLFALGRV